MILWALSAVAWFVVAVAGLVSGQPFTEVGLAIALMNTCFIMAELRDR